MNRRAARAMLKIVQRIDPEAELRGTRDAPPSLSTPQMERLRAVPVEFDDQFAGQPYKPKRPPFTKVEGAVTARSSRRLVESNCSGRRPAHCFLRTITFDRNACDVAWCANPADANISSRSSVA